MRFVIAGLAIITLSQFEHLFADDTLLHVAVAVGMATVVVALLARSR